MEAGPWKGRRRFDSTEFRKDMDILYNAQPPGRYEYKEVRRAHICPSSLFGVLLSREFLVNSLITAYGQLVYDI
jgi:hypothetical protein